MESIRKEFERLEIQLQDIKSATDNFDKTKIIGYGGFGDVYEGEMCHSKGRSMVAIKRLVRRHGQGEPEFLKEISILSRYSHKNIVTLVGFCDHGDEKILVYEHAARGSLDLHLSSPDLTWTRRIKICLDAAKGLGYLHDPRETHQRVLHRDIKSSNILLDADWNAKISDMGLSKIGPANQLYTALITGVAGTFGYCDPQYLKTYTLTKESDIYSFGVVLFEVLCGKLCYQKTNQIEILVPKWKQSYQENKLDAIIFRGLVQPMDPSSLKIFSDIAFQCLQKSNKRPSMSLIVEKLENALRLQEPHDLTLQNEEITPLTKYRSIVEPEKLLPKQINPSFMEAFQHLKIRLEEIKSVTNNFDVKNVIGAGRFWKVYKGEVSHYKGRSMVAFKRLDRQKYKEDPHFWKKIMQLFSYTHQNLITLLGICDEDSEVILVYEYAAYGSLNLHLSSPALTWTRRIKICLDAAKGLGYLHDPREIHQRTAHRDIKSSNILLDANWNAKVSDVVGASELQPASEEITFLFWKKFAGTHGYADPLFMERGILTEESDIYSFGVVLFEVLCGRVCFENNDGMSMILVPIWKQRYKDKELDKIIFQDAVQPMDPTSLNIFSDIAFQCLKKSHEKRPKISLVVEKFETALKFQERHDLELQEYEEILKAAVPPLRYRSLMELKQLLANGIYLYGEKRWFSLNENGKRCEVISIAECLIPADANHHIFQYSPEYTSRFPAGCYETFGKKFKTHVKTQLLSPLITYTVNLVFKFKYGKKESKQQYIALKYRLEGETKTSISYLADEREDEWLIAELYQFTNDGTTIDLEIIFEDNSEWLLVDGIEFQPMKKVEYEVSEDKNVDIQIVSDQDAYWDQKLPNDYQHIIKWAKDGVKWTTKKELYWILCKGLLINKGQEWFSLDKNGKKCVMLSPRAARVISRRDPTCQSSHKSRFGEVLQIEYDYILNLHGDIKSRLVSPDTIYASYLVYKLPEDQIKCEAPVEVRCRDIFGPLDRKKGDSWYIFLASPKTPVIAGGKVDRNTYNPLNRPKLEGIPQKRSDNWMEVQVWKFRTTSTTKKIHMHLSLTSRSPLWLHGLIIQGIEFRPI